MKKQLFNDWISALRSGELKQTTRRLFDGEGYCCLGVLCKVAGRETTPTSENDDDWEESKENYRFVRNVLEEGTVEALMEMNDAGKTFPEIADFIEKHKEEIELE